MYYHHTIGKQAEPEQNGKCWATILGPDRALSTWHPRIAVGIEEVRIGAQALESSKSKNSKGEEAGPRIAAHARRQTASALICHPIWTRSIDLNMEQPDRLAQQSYCRGV